MIVEDKARTDILKDTSIEIHRQTRETWIYYGIFQNQKGSKKFKVNKATLQMILLKV